MAHAMSSMGRPELSVLASAVLLHVHDAPGSPCLMMRSDLVLAFRFLPFHITVQAAPTRQPSEALACAIMVVATFTELPQLVEAFTAGFAGRRDCCSAQGGLGKVRGDDLTACQHLCELFAMWSEAGRGRGRVNRVRGCWFGERLAPKPMLLKFFFFLLGFYRRGFRERCSGNQVPRSLFGDRAPPAEHGIEVAWAFPGLTATLHMQIARLFTLLNACFDIALSDAAVVGQGGL